MTVVPALCVHIEPLHVPGKLFRHFSAYYISHEMYGVHIYIGVRSLLSKSAYDPITAAAAASLQ